MIIQKDEESLRWFQRLCDAWMSKDVPTALSLFSQCENYRETPFAENAADRRDGIKALWLEILDQSDIVAEVRLRAIGNEVICAQYTAKFSVEGKRTESSGIWIAQFRNGSCISFEQWFMNCEN